MYLALLHIFLGVGFFLTPKRFRRWFYVYFC
nr:MAG TPA: hypothetical protein [Caudoviricetes sp.]